MREKGEEMKSAFLQTSKRRKETISVKGKYPQISYAAKIHLAIAFVETGKANDGLKYWKCNLGPYT